MVLKAGFDGANAVADNGDMIKEAGCAVPIVLMDEDAALGVETDDGNAQRPDGLAFGYRLELIIHYPAKVVESVAAARDIVKLNGQGDGVLRGTEEIGLDVGCPTNGLEGVIQPGIGCVDLEGVGSNAFGAPLAEKMFQSVDGQPFGVRSSDYGWFGRFFGEDGAESDCVVGLAGNGFTGGQCPAQDQEQ